MSFELDYEGLGKLLRGTEMRAMLATKAEAVKVRAEAMAPVDKTGPHPGRYKASFKVETGIHEGKTRRAYARVINTAPEAILVEYGSRNNPRHRTLGRALGFAKD
jgi:hypothetical protein